MQTKQIEAKLRNIELQVQEPYTLTITVYQVIVASKIPTKLKNSGRKFSD